MALDMWFRNEVLDHVCAVAVGMVCASLASGENVEYRRGVIEACRAVVLSFGIEPRQVEVLARAELEAGDG